jgi:hypothetical protein
MIKMVCRDFWDISTGTGPGARRLRRVRMSPKLNPNARCAPDEDEGAELAKTIVGDGGNLKGSPGIGRSTQRLSRAAQMLNGPQLKLLEAWSSKRKNAPVEAIPKNGNEVAKPKRSSLRQRADPASHHLKPTHWAGRRATEGEPTPATPRDCAVQGTNGQVTRPYGRVRQTYWRLPPAHGAKSAPSRWSRSCRR